MKDRILKRLGSSLFDQSARTNLLLFTGTEHRPTHDLWNQAVDRVTPKKVHHEGGDEGFTRPAGRYNTAGLPDSQLPKSLPSNFCVFCGRTDITKELATGEMYLMFTNAYPGLRIKPLDGVKCWACEPCCQELFNEKQESPICVDDCYWVTKREERQRKAEENIVEYIASARLTGTKGEIFGDESRREKYKEYDSFTD